MKKIITYAIMLLVGIFAGASLIPALANSNLFTPTNNRLEMISEQQAMEIALNNSDESFEVIKIELEDLDDDDDVEYEITLRNESKEVEVEINAYSGKINEWDEKLLQASSNNQTQMIGIEQAKRIALEKAGSSFEITKAQLDDDDDDDVEYDIKLISSEYKIEAEVDAYTGQIMKWEAKRVNKSSVTNTTPSTPTMITKERAIEIATKKAGSNFNVIEVELDDDDDDDDDDIEYEIKLRSSTQEIEVEIDAYTGAITEWEVETFKSTTNNTTPSTPTMITKERAIEIARAKIGSNPVLEEIELDDDGKMVYELEFEHGDVEYEFEIDAYTGQILEFEIDD